MLVGPAGSGKTRLASELLAAAERGGSATARAAATRATSRLPFGAFAPLLPDEPASGSVEHRAAFLSQCCAEVAERAEGRRLVLLVDDAHLLDEASAALTHQLAVTGSAFVLTTMRAKSAAPDAIVALWKDGFAERHDLGPLSAQAVEALLVHVLGGPVEAATVAGLVSRSKGNPLFVRELVLAALASGALSRMGGSGA